MHLNIEIKKLDDGHIVHLTGEVDVYTASKLREAIIPLTIEKNINLVVDMEEVGYIDSTGLGVFIGALKSSYQHESTLKLIGLTDKIERLFRITGLSELIDIESKVRGDNGERTL